MTFVASRDTVEAGPREGWNRRCRPCACLAARRASSGGGSAPEGTSVTRSPDPPCHHQRPHTQGLASPRFLRLCLRRPIGCWFRCDGRSSFVFPHIKHDLVPPVLGWFGL